MSRCDTPALLPSRGADLRMEVVLALVADVDDHVGGGILRDRDAESRADREQQRLEVGFGQLLCRDAAQERRAGTGSSCRRTSAKNRRAPEAVPCATPGRRLPRGWQQAGEATRSMQQPGRRRADTAAALVGDRGPTPRGRPPIGRTSTRSAVATLPPSPKRNGDGNRNRDRPHCQLSRDAIARFGTPRCARCRSTPPATARRAPRYRGTVPAPPTPDSPRRHRACCAGWTGERSTPTHGER